MTWNVTGPIMVDRGDGPEPLGGEPPPARLPRPRLRALGWFWPERRWYWFESWQLIKGKAELVAQYSGRLTADEADEEYIDLLEEHWNATSYRWKWTGTSWQKERPS